MAESQFGPYLLRQLLSRSAFVYEAEDTEQDLTVTLKLFPPVNRERFAHDMRIAAQLTAPHILTIQSWGELNGQCYAVAQGRSGRPLAALLGQLSPPRAVAMIEQLAAALDFLRASGLMHRNIGPDNIIVTAGNAYLLSFDITVVDAPTRQADVYSLARVLADALDPETLPPALGAVIARGLADTPQARFATADDLASAARAALAPPRPYPQRWKRTPVAIALVAVLIVAVGVVIGRVNFSHAQRAPSSASSTATPENPQPTGYRQIALPFTGLRMPAGVAVDAAGNVYVADTGNQRVVMLASGSSIQTVLPFANLHRPVGLAVDGIGNVYVVNLDDKRVYRLAPGATTPTVLPFTDRRGAQDVAVDADCSVYVARSDDYVAKLAAGSTDQTVLPFTDLEELSGVAVDADGDVYVTSTRVDQVVVLRRGTTRQAMLAVTGVRVLDGVAVDAAGNVYVSSWSDDQVVELVAEQHPCGQAGCTPMPVDCSSKF